MVSSTNIKLPEASGGYSNSKEIRTNDGVFYTGMTANNAKNIGRYKNILRRDFTNLDKNKDNILTNDEIILERERDAKMFLWDILLVGFFAAINIYSSIENKKFLNFIFSGIFSLLTAESIILGSKVHKNNKKLKKELSIKA